MTSTNLDNKKTKYEKLPNKKTFYLNDKNRQKQEKKMLFEGELFLFSIREAKIIFSPPLSPLHQLSMSWMKK